MTTRELIEAAMYELINMPCGGIGEDGPTRSEIEAANEAGQPVGDDAAYHASQSAWLHLNEALKQL